MPFPLAVLTSHRNFPFIWVNRLDAAEGGVRLLYMKNVIESYPAGEPQYYVIGVDTQDGKRWLLGGLCPTEGLTTLVELAPRWGRGRTYGETMANATIKMLRTMLETGCNSLLLANHDSSISGFRLYEVRLQEVAVVEDTDAFLRASQLRNQSQDQRRYDVVRGRAYPADRSVARGAYRALGPCPRVRQERGRRHCG